MFGTTLPQGQISNERRGRCPGRHPDARALLESPDYLED
jgi:hypothetical protein